MTVKSGGWRRFNNRPSQDNSRAVDTMQNVRAIFQRDLADMAPLDLEGILCDLDRIVAAAAL
jgi:hypothetical protein